MREDKGIDMSEERMNFLCDLHGTDKGTGTDRKNTHNYTKVYSEIFDSLKDENIIVFECGIGTNYTDVPSNMGKDGKPGASLRLWKDYFANAHVYGADIDDRILFQEERISTGKMNQLEKESIDDFFQSFNNFSPNIIIDDGLHNERAARSLYDNCFPRLANNGIYVIEDVDYSYCDSLLEYVSSDKDNRVDLHKYIGGNTKNDNTLIVIYKGFNKS